MTQHRRRITDLISDDDLEDVRQVEVNAQRYLTIKAVNRHLVESIFAYLPEAQRKAQIDAWCKNFDASVDGVAAELFRCKGVLA